MPAQEVTYLGSFVAGLLSFLSPCVLPLIPSYITFITRLSFADLQAEHPAHKVRQTAMLHSLAFILGFTAVFVLLGASATYVGSFLNQHAGIIRKSGGILIVLFGIHVTGLIPITMLMGEKRITLHRKPAGYFGTFLVGLSFAAGWTPCIGPILATILMVAATEENVYHGIMLLLLYSLGLGIPFFLSSLAMHQFIVIFQRFKKYIRYFEIVTGIFLMLVGIIIYFNWLTRLSAVFNMLVGGAA